MLKPFQPVPEQTVEARMMMQAHFSVEPADQRCLFVPYRICPLGAHVDHQGGHVLGRVIPTGTVLVYAPLPGPDICLVSPQFPGLFRTVIGETVKLNHWGRYAQAAALALSREHHTPHGLVGVSSGTLPSAGLSSSASVGLALLQALADVNHLSLSKADFLNLDCHLEQDYLGLNNGMLDPATILYGQGNALVYTDTRHHQTRLIPDPPTAESAGWLIAYSGISRELTAGEGFNQRVAECQAAARWLEPKAVRLSDIPPEKFHACAAEMPEPPRRRAAHYFSEVARVADGIEAWQEGDFARFGDLMNASCASSIDQYESGHEAVIALQNVVSGIAGVYGSRFSGGGYGGCVVALVERTQAGAIASRILLRYQQHFPELASQSATYWVANGSGP